MLCILLTSTGEIAAIAVTLLNECSDEIFASTLKAFGRPVSNTTIIMESI